MSDSAPHKIRKTEAEWRDQLTPEQYRVTRKHGTERAFTGPNCRGEEKVRRLRAAYGADVKLAAAYGDTSGDTEMLAFAAEAGFRVFTARP